MPCAIDHASMRVAARAGVYSANARAAAVRSASCYSVGVPTRRSTQMPRHARGAREIRYALPVDAAIRDDVARQPRWLVVYRSR